MSSGFSECRSVEEMFKCWRYTVVRDDSHFVVESFDGEKLGDDTILWEHLEKLVEKNSKISLVGEDGTHFRWTFKDNKFKETYADVTYEDDEE